MNHYFRRDPRRNGHVDTLIDGERWQPHVHSEAAFSGWSELMAGSAVIGLPDADW